jgi:RimJ/RimL family protein N-acetyltransferase
MTTAATALPMLGLRITAGPLELRGITDDLLGPLVDLALGGIHAPDAMPFTVPWTLAAAEELPRIFVQYYWGLRAKFSVTEWSVTLAAFWEGELAGVQGMETRDYLVTRTAETGSWLGRRFQGRGIGTAMRQVICAFAFDHLNAEYMMSGAFTDNPASLGVSKKVGYAENGWQRMARLGKPATQQRLVLTAGRLVRYEHELAVTGLPEFRQSIGLVANKQH